MNIPQKILRQLMCSLCGGYLNSSPIMVKNDNAQICGKCFKILPEEERTKYVRQIGLEAVSEMLIFPCRYNLEGCKSEFLWNNSIDHEAECPHRHNILNKNEINFKDERNVYDNVDGINTETLDFFRERDNYKMNMTYFLYPSEKFDHFDCLKFNMKIISTSHSTTINYETGTKDGIQILVEGAISLLNPPKTIYGDMKIISGTENIYATIGSDSLQHPEDISYSKQTKGQIYTRLPNSNAKNCLSYFNGARRYANQPENVSKTYQCPLNGCVFSGSISEMQIHLEISHAEQTILDKSVTKTLQKTDSTWFMMCFNDVFKCSYFCYEHGVDFLVVYLGPNNNAKNFKFEIDIAYRSKFGKTSNFTNRRPCIGWNEFALDSGIFISQDNLSTFKVDKVLTFTLNLITV